MADLGGILYSRKRGGDHECQCGHMAMCEGEWPLWTSYNSDV